MDETLSSKIQNALDANQSVRQYLAKNRLSGWLEYFDAIDSALRADDPDGAQQAREHIPMPNMGGFGEVIDMDDELRVRFMLLSTALGNLKVWQKYKANRPLVEISDSSVLRAVQAISEKRAQLQPWWIKLLAKLTTGS